MRRISFLWTLLLAIASIGPLSSCGNDASPAETVEMTFTPSDINDFTLNYYPERNGYVIEDYHGHDKEVFVPLEANINGVIAPIVEIGDYAFAHREMEIIHLGESVRKLGEIPFHQSKLKKLYVTPYLVDIQANSFDNCPLEWNQKDGINYLPGRYGPYGYVFSYNGTIDDQIYLPEECEAVYPGVFGGAQQIHFGKKMIGFGNLRGNWPLGDMHPRYIPNWTNEGLKEITTTLAGQYAFKDWTSLEKVTILDTARTIFGAAFYGCTSLKEVVMPETINMIRPYAFAKCSSLETIKLSKNITYIGNYAFAKCTSLKTLELPDGLVDYGFYVMYGNDAFEYNEYENCLYMAFRDNQYHILVKAKNTDISELIFHPDCHVIDDEAFAGCTKLTELTIPDSIYRIGYEVFKDCGNITSLTIGSNSTFDALSLPIAEVTVTGTGTLSKNAFNKCETLTRATISEGVEGIGDGSFYHCANLSEISLPSTLTSIGSSAFSECTSLRNVILPDNLETIGEFAFSECTSLGSIFIPKSVTNMSKYVFFKSNVTVYCEAESRPSEWDKDFAFGCQVYWGYKPTGAES